MDIVVKKKLNRIEQKQKNSTTERQKHEHQLVSLTYVAAQDIQGLGSVNHHVDSMQSHRQISVMKKWLPMTFRNFVQSTNRDNIVVSDHTVADNNVTNDTNNTTVVTEITIASNIEPITNVLNVSPVDHKQSIDNKKDSSKIEKNLFQDLTRYKTILLQATCTETKHSIAQTIDIPHWANYCIIIAVAGGERGYNATIDSANCVVSSGRGGTGGSAIMNNCVPLNVCNCGSLMVQVGCGGGRHRDQPYGSDTTICWTYAPQYDITLLGGRSINVANITNAIVMNDVTTDNSNNYTDRTACIIPGYPGEKGISVFGSQGSPCGGNGGASAFAPGASGGIPTDRNRCNGQSANIGGGGGGGGAPWGATGCGGHGGDGFVRLEFLE